MIQLGATHDFNNLVQNISDIQDFLQAQTAHAINLSLTVRNWLIGCYIVEYEQHGEVRAQYGDNLLNRLSQKIGKKGLDARRLREFRQVYLAYPQLAEEVGKYLKNNIHSLSSNDSKWRLPSAIFEGDTDALQIWRMPSAKLSSQPEGWETKIDRFRHEYASQLNLYLNYFKHEIMQPDDNPPVGLLLCTDYGETTVKYATEGLSQNLFVSKYKLQLPSEDEIKKFLIDNFSHLNHPDD